MPDILEDQKLAIIVPAFKADFLAKALACLVQQTDQRFNLYVYDDASPADIEGITRSTLGARAYIFKRFEKNLGGTSLVQQWERCIRLSREPWIWLFSDDDLMEPGCVAAFHEELEKTNGQHDLYRFNTVWVNTTKNSSEENSLHPTEETGVDFLRMKLRNIRRSTLQELIFSRAAWEACGGIPDFPRAWASDDAFITKLGGRRTIKTIAGPRVIWRLSDVNITNDNSAASVRAKLNASEAFIRWMIDYFEQAKPIGQKPDRLEINRLTENWLFAFVERCWRFMDWHASRQIEKISTEIWGHSSGHGFYKTQKFNFHHFVRKCSGKIKRLFSGHA